MNVHRLAALATAALLAVTSAWPAAAEPPVRLGQISISFYAVTGQVVQSVLERLGHNVDLRTGLHSEMFPQLGQGSIDLLVAAWLPYAHAKYWSAHGGDAVELATLYRGAQLFWAVPHYVPAGEVASVADLGKASVAGRMAKQIRATKPDTGLTMGSQRVMQAYDLEAAGYRLLTGEHHEWQRNFEARYRAGDWFVMPYFRPNFLNRMADMRKLEEPLELLGQANRAVLAAHKDFVARAPKQTVRVLGRIELDLDAVAEMDYMVRIDGLSPRDAATRWMDANTARVDAWFADD